MAAREKKTVSSAKPAAEETAKATTKASSAKTAATKTAAKTTARRTTTKRAAVPAVTEAMIAERAYSISQSHECGSDVDNWLRAEAELVAA